MPIPDYMERNLDTQAGFAVYKNVYFYDPISLQMQDNRVVLHECTSEEKAQYLVQREMSFNPTAEIYYEASRITL